MLLVAKDDLTPSGLPSDRCVQFLIVTDANV